MKHWKAYVAVVAAMIIWAGSGIATKTALLTFSPLTLIVLRFTASVLLMLVIGLIIKKGELHLVRIQKSDIPVFLLCGFFQPVLYFIFETFTYKTLASPTVAEALLSTNPLIAPLFAFAFLRERITWNNVVGILVSTIGMLMLVLSFGTTFSLGSPFGILLAIFAVLSAVSYSTLLKKIPTRYNSLSIVFYAQFVSLFFFYPIWAFVDLPHLSWTMFAVPELGKSLLALGYQTVFSSVLAFIFFCYTVREIGVTRANVFNNIRPAFTALIMLALFSEHLPWFKWLGIVLVIFGLFISQKARKD